VPSGFGLFMVVWVAVGVAGFYLFGVRRDAAFKRRWFRWYIIAAAIAFLAFVLVTVDQGLRPEVLFLVVPAVALIAFLNIWGTRFCASCGRTIYTQWLFSRPRYCSHCGAKLE
jgi:hypothetical protein